MQIEKTRIAGQLKSARAQLETATKDRELAELESFTARAELNVASRDLTERMISAPFAGSVVTVHNFQGEWVKSGDPIITMVRMDKLRVESFLDVEVLAPHQAPGTDVRFVIDHQGGEFVGRIESCAPKIDADGKYQVWFEVEK